MEVGRIFQVRQIFHDTGLILSLTLFPKPKLISLCQGFVIPDFVGPGFVRTPRFTNDHPSIGLYTKRLNWTSFSFMTNFSSLPVTDNLIRLYTCPKIASWRSTYITKYYYSLNIDPFIVVEQGRQLSECFTHRRTLLSSSSGPSTEGGWRQTVSNLGQGGSFPLAFPTWTGKINPRTFYQLIVVLLCGICLLWQLTVKLPVLRG